MARIIKTKKKHQSRLYAIACGLFFCAMAACMIKTLFLNTIANGITVDIENINREVAVLESQNDALNLEIQNLMSKDRVYDIATEAGLSQNQNNVISVVEGE